MNQANKIPLVEQELELFEALKLWSYTRGTLQFDNESARKLAGYVADHCLGLKPEGRTIFIDAIVAEADRARVDMGKESTPDRDSFARKIGENLLTEAKAPRQREPA